MWVRRVCVCVLDVCLLSFFTKSYIARDAVKLQLPIMARGSADDTHRRRQHINAIANPHVRPMSLNVAGDGRQRYVSRAPTSLRPGRCMSSGKTRSTPWLCHARGRHAWAACVGGMGVKEGRG